MDRTKHPIAECLQSGKGRSPSFAVLPVLLDTTLVAHDIRKVAVHAEVDPRTVESYLRGASLRPMTRMRIERALLALGYAKVIA